MDEMLLQHYGAAKIAAKASDPKIAILYPSSAILGGAVAAENFQQPVTA